MGTRATISIETSKNVFETIWIQCDGAPGFMGRCLLAYYSTYEKALELVKHGPVCGLRSKPENAESIEAKPIEYKDWVANGSDWWGTYWVANAPSPVFKLDSAYDYIMRLDGKWSVNSYGIPEIHLETAVENAKNDPDAPYCPDVDACYSK